MMQDLISRQVAIDALMDAVKKVGILDADDIKAVFDMLPIIQPVATDTNVGKNSEIPNSSDCISRQAAIDAIRCDIVVTGRENAELVAKTMGEFIDRIKSLPSVQPDTQCYLGSPCEYQNPDVVITQPERPKGEWIDYTEDGYVECPFCHSATNCDGNKDELHFCFSCGADMRGERYG